jgi:signal transduction histidine kinase
LVINSDLFSMEHALQNRLTLITEAGKVLTATLRSPSALQQLAELVVSTIADVCAIDLLRNDGQLQRVAIAFPKSLADADAVLAGEFRDTVFHIPLPIDGGKLGEIIMVRRGSSIAPEDVEVASDIARMTALALENTRLYEQAQNALFTVRNQAANIRCMNEGLERRVAERTNELEAANREMSIVNYTVSHDLRAHLRSLEGYSQMLLEDFAPSLPAGARSYVEKLIHSTRDVNQLLDGLLSFCKMSGHSLNRQPVPLEDLVRQALETLRPRMAGRGLDIRLGQLDEADVDPMLVRQVFINLIANALTYTSVREPAVIEIGQIVEPGRQPVLFVKDNGIGFDPGDEARLFEPFRRLHAAAGYEGSGVGLSIVSSIVQRHGGRIWAIGAPDAGATFFFTLGLRQQERLAS